MPDTPYCPLLSIGKDVPVMCQEELCMWYVKQLKLCSLTVMAYTQALNLQGPQVSAMQTGAQTQKTQQTPQQFKQDLTQAPKKEAKTVNPFALDDLD